MDAQPGVIGTGTMEPDHCLIHEALRLQRGSVLRVENGRDTLVRARHGCVWLTQEGERRDIVLQFGQQFRISRDGRTLIGALRDSEIELVSADRKRLAQRIDLALPGGTSAFGLYVSASDWRHRMATLGERVKRAWLGLHAPPRRARQIV